MKNFKNMMRLLLVLLILPLFGPIEIEAQSRDQIPREYANPEETLSFDRRTDFQDALEIINQYAQDFEGRFILDRTGATGPIGVSLPVMHWKDALNYILRSRNLISIESPDFYEIVTEQEAEQMLDRGVSGDPTGQRPQSIEVGDGLNINTKTREIRINATFFEGNKRALREIGVDWSTLTSNVPENLTDFVSGGNEQIPSTEFGNQFVSVNARAASSVSQNVFNSLVNFGEIGGGVSVQALFSAFEADNLGEVLATPGVKVMDGEEGRVQVGEDFSIKQRDFAGNVTDQFVSTGTILTIRPQLVEIGDTTLIYLELEAERSSAQPDPVSTIVSKQQATTTSILLDGESTVIAGLYRSEKSEVRRGVPILKDLPGWFFGLKYLFGFNSTDVTENELIIIVQAELEESIDTRMQKAFRSPGGQLSQRKLEHRNYMNYISDESPVPPSAPAVEPYEAPSVDADLMSEEESEPAKPVEITTPKPEKSEVDISEIRPVTEMRDLRPGEVRGASLDNYQGPWRPMELDNLNGDYDNLDFYVIGGAFIVRDNADGLYKRFIDEGFEAHMLYNPATDYYFVAFAGFEEPEEAVRYLRKIQNERLPDAWISRIIRQERRLNLNR